MDNTNTTQQEEYYKVEKYKEYLVLKDFSKGTQRSLISSSRQMAQWAEQENIEIQNITHNEILSYINHLKKKGNKQRSIQTAMSHVKNYFNFLLDEEDINDNPCSHIDIKGIKRKILYETFTPGELEDIYKRYVNKPHSNAIAGKLIHKRNTAILGLIIYQGIRTEEIGKLNLEDIKLREGKIYIAGNRRTNERTLKLESHQVIDLMDYLQETRKIIVLLRGAESKNVFLSLGNSERFNNMMTSLHSELKKQTPKLKDIKQLRASVISNWLKIHGLRKTQHMAGHRYVSSTEAYQINNMEDLQEDVNRYHPDI